MTTIPRPEHPRPQFIRDNWMNLNGQWDFLFDFSNSGVERELYKNSNFTAAFPQKITVPFCPESALSGIGYTDYIPAVWYRRTLTITEEQRKGRVLIHFGAVDYHAILYVNEKKAGEHKGGYSSFTFDITDWLKDGENLIVLYAEDDIRSAKQPFGKQSILCHSAGCSYTRTTGIWQTVWVEFVPENYIQYAKITPFADDRRAIVDVETIGGRQVTATAYYQGKQVGMAKSSVVYGRASLVLDLDELHLWDIRQPNLYDLTLTLDGEDELQSYFGMRKIELKKDCLWLNDRPIFMRTILDQGYNPEGIYTAPSDEFLKRDIELSLDLGFNGGRFHQRVFEERSLYHADRLGYLVWGEYATGTTLGDASGIGYLLPEWMETVRRDYSHPSIIGWCPENESYNMWCPETKSWSGRYNDPICQETYYHVTKQMDPYRPVIDASGGIHWKTDMYDIHEYEQDPERLRELLAPMIDNPSYIHDPLLLDPTRQEQAKACRYEGQPYWVSEYGGARWNLEDASGWGYSQLKTVEEFAAQYEGLTAVLLEHPRICGFSYTQLTDIEQEQNGLYKYDRSPKFADEIYDRIREANMQEAAIEKRK